MWLLENSDFFKLRCFVKESDNKYRAFFFCQFLVLRGYNLAFKNSERVFLHNLKTKKYSCTRTAHFVAATLQDRCSNLAVLHSCSAMSM